MGALLCILIAMVLLVFTNNAPVIPVKIAVIFICIMFAGLAWRMSPWSKK